MFCLKCSHDSAYYTIYVILIFVYFYVLQKLQGSLEAAYGQACKAESSDEVFEKFFEWKNAKQEEFSRVRNATDSSLRNLVMCFSGIIKVKMTLSILQKSKTIRYYCIFGCSFIFQMFQC